MPAYAPSRTPRASAPAFTTEAVLARRCFRAMNTSVELTLMDLAQAPALHRGEEFFHAFERRFSRFLPTSELSALNERRGTSMTVSPELLSILRTCQRLHTLTGGIFDPTIIDALEAAGYDRSFELLGEQWEHPRNGAVASGGLSELVVDESASSIFMPPHLRIDLGGIGKGYAVDLLGRTYDEASTGPFLIVAGGDVQARGDGPSGDGWLISVYSEHHRAEIDRIVIRDESVATSTTGRRRWRRGEREMHHIIDPRTGEPAAGGVTSVTVIAPTATDADVFAKTALILGPNPGREFLEDHRAQGLLVLDDGRVLTAGDWPGNANTDWVGQ